MAALVNTLLTVVVSALVSGTITGILKAAIDRKYAEATTEAAKRKATQKEYAVLQKKWQHAVGRVLYHLVRKVQGEPINGDLDKSYHELEEVEAQQKDLEQEQIVDVMNE